MAEKNYIINLNPFLNLVKKNISTSKKNFSKNDLPMIFKKNKISLDIRNFLNSKIKKNKILKLRIFNFIVKYPVHKFGKTNFIDCINSGELDAFNFYKKNKKHYKKVLDLGANVGLHTIILAKLGFDVTSFEPENTHFRLLKNNCKLNNVKCKIVKKAVYNMDGEVTMIKIHDHTPGSHIAGSKKNPYGKLSKHKVKTVNFKKLIKKYDLIKIDIEGAEKKIIETTSIADWKKTDAMVEIHNPENAKFIWNKFKNSEINFYSQKTRKKINNIKSFPKNYTEGMVLITNKSNLF